MGFAIHLPRKGITIRIALLAWSVTLITLVFFVTIIVPQQKKEFQLNLESKARGVAVSIRGVAAGAAVSEDYSAVVDQTMQVLAGDDAIDYVVITKDDGFAIIIDRTQWKVAKLDASWHPLLRVPSRSIGVSPLFGRRLFQYALPFDYSGIQWGWIHVGMSLKAYDESVRRTYESTVWLTILCGLMSLMMSVLYATRLVQPVQGLHEAVAEVSRGNLRVRAKVSGNDELGDLARGFNEMAENLQNARTELEQRQQRLQLLMEAAESANKAKSQFLANMSHELRTPMNAIIGYSEMLIEEAADVGLRSSVPDLQRIRGAGKHLLALISDILDLSKIEAGKMDLYLETFDVERMIGDLGDTIQPLVAKNANTLAVEVAPDIGSMCADLTKVRQALFNLLSNACKFTHNGFVQLKAYPTTEGGASWVVFEVKDSGIGMDAEAMEKVFEAFKQADASTTRKYGGTGLGLTITRSFVEMMGGDIHVSSQPGVGTTFTVRLPELVVAPESAPTEPKKQQPTETLPGIHQLNVVLSAAEKSGSPPVDGKTAIETD